MNKLKITVNYGWAGIPNDEMIITDENLGINFDELSENDIAEIATEAAEEMIYNKIGFDWEVYEE